MFDLFPTHYPPGTPLELIHKTGTQLIHILVHNRYTERKLLKLYARFEWLQFCSRKSLTKGFVSVILSERKKNPHGRSDLTRTGDLFHPKVVR